MPSLILVQLQDCEVQALANRLRLHLNIAQSNNITSLDIVEALRGSVSDYPAVFGSLVPRCCHWWIAPFLKREPNSDSEGELRNVPGLQGFAELMTSGSDGSAVFYLVELLSWIVAGRGYNENRDMTSLELLPYYNPGCKGLVHYRDRGIPVGTAITPFHSKAGCQLIAKLRAVASTVWGEYNQYLRLDLSRSFKQIFGYTFALHTQTKLVQLLHDENWQGAVELGKLNAICLLLLGQRFFDALDHDEQIQFLLPTPVGKMSKWKAPSLGCLIVASYPACEWERLLTATIADCRLQELWLAGSIFAPYIEYLESLEDPETIVLVLPKAGTPTSIGERGKVRIYCLERQLTPLMVRDGDVSSRTSFWQVPTDGWDLQNLPIIEERNEPTSAIARYWRALKFLVQGSES